MLWYELDPSVPSRKTLAEVADEFEGSSELERIQNLVAFLFKGAPIDWQVVTWDYFVKQFMSLYYNREMSVFHVEQFRSLLIGQLMRYKGYMDALATDLLSKIADGGFDLKEELTRLVAEDRKRDTESNTTETGSGKTTTTESGTDSETMNNETVDAATGKQTTVDDIKDVTHDEGTNTLSGTNAGESISDGTGKRTNTGTQTTDRTGTENRTRSDNESEEGLTTTKGTTKTDSEGRTLRSDTPQSMVNAESTGLAADVSWEYASGLMDDIKHQTVTQDVDVTTDKSTVGGGTDQLVLDTQDKTTDNRVEDTTSHDKTTTTGETSSTGASSADRTYDRDATSTVDSSADNTSTTTGSKTGSTEKSGEVDQTASKSGTVIGSDMEDLNRNETVHRVLSKLTPFEGNTKLLNFLMTYMEEPVMRVVNEMDKLFLLTYMSFEDERFRPFGWAEREGCVTKL